MSGYPAAIFRMLLAAAAGAGCVWLLAPLFESEPPLPPPPAWEWAPGYWELNPTVGIARIIPIAPCRLVNPPADAAPEDLPLQGGATPGENMPF